MNGSTAKLLRRYASALELPKRHVKRVWRSLPHTMRHRAANEIREATRLAIKAAKDKENEEK